MKITWAVPAMFAALAALTMKTIITSNWRPLHRALWAVFLCIASFWAMPRNACAQIYVSQGNYKVGAYNATTGKAINASFITGLSGAGGIVSGNSFFVTNNISNTVGEYNSTTGAVIKANFITGLDGPAALALSGNALFVANYFGYSGNTVGKYYAATGKAIKASFITGLPSPQGLAISGNTLFVVNEYNSVDRVPNSGTVGAYNATTGTPINPINPNVITGLKDPVGLAISGNTLFVSTGYGNTVGEYNATTGAAINANFIKGLSGAGALAVKQPK
jgi:hypothetical protein